MSKQGRTLFSYPVLFWGVIALTLALRLLGLNRGLWIDEYSSLTFASKEGFWATAFGYNNPPLYYLLLKAWRHLGTSEPWIRLLSVGLSVATAGVLMTSLKPRSKTAALVAGVLFATLPEMLKYGSEIRAHSLFLLATVGVFFFADRFSRTWNDKRALLGLGACLLLAMFTQSIGLFLLGAVFAFLLSSRLLSGEAVPWKTLARLGLAALVVTSLFALWLAPHLSQRDWIPSVTWIQAAKVFFESLGVPARALSGKAAGFDELAATPALEKIGLVWVLLSLCTLLCLVPFGNWRKHAPYFYAFIALWLQLVFCSLFFRPVLIGRTALMTLIPLVAFLALQTASLRRPARTAAFAALASLCLISSFTWARWGAYLSQENWKKVFTILEREWHAGDVLILAPWWLGKEGIGKYHFPVPEPDVMALHRPDDDVGYQQKRFKTYLEQKLKTDPESRVFLITRKFQPTEWTDILVPALGSVPAKLVEGPVRLYLWKTPLKAPKVANGNTFERMR